MVSDQTADVLAHLEQRVTAKPIAALADALETEVYEQVRAGEPETGYEYGDPTFPDCPHWWCGEKWHGLAITRRMRQMRARGEIDVDYRYVDDDSEVLCPGSLFEGEFEPPCAPIAHQVGLPVLISASDYALLGTPDPDTMYMVVPDHPEFQRAWLNEPIQARFGGSSSDQAVDR